MHDLWFILKIWALIPSFTQLELIQAANGPEKKNSLLGFKHLCHVTVNSNERGSPPKVYKNKSSANVDKYVLAKFFERV